MSSKIEHPSITKLKEIEKRRLEETRIKNIKSNIPKKETKNVVKRFIPHNHGPEDYCTISCYHYGKDHYANKSMEFSIKDTDKELEQKLYLQLNGGVYEEYITSKEHFERLGGYSILTTSKQRELWKEIVETNNW